MCSVFLAVCRYMAGWAVHSVFSLLCVSSTRVPVGSMRGTWDGVGAGHPGQTKPAIIGVGAPSANYGAGVYRQVLSAPIS